MTTLNSVINLQGNKASFVTSHITATAKVIIDSPELSELTAAGKSALMSAATFGGHAELSLEDTVLLAVLLDRQVTLTTTATTTDAVVPAAVVAPVSAAAVEAAAAAAKIEAVVTLVTTAIPEIIALVKQKDLAGLRSYAVKHGCPEDKYDQLVAQFLPLIMQLTSAKTDLAESLHTMIKGIMVDVMKDVLTTPIAA